MAHRVFISYSSHDKTVADAVCAALESAQVQCWVAPRDILPGSSYGASIVDAIEASRVLVLILSSHANASPQVIREIERAGSKGITILPFRIDNAPLTKEMEYFVSSRHWLDALTPPLEGHLPALAKSVRALLAAKDGGAPAAPATAAREVVLFLDFDGVLHPADNHRQDDFVNLPRFESIMREFPSVKIVIASSWRLAIAWDELVGRFSPPLAYRIIGKTPDLNGKSHYEEIRAYLRKHPPGHDNWLALDDDGQYPADCPNLVRCDSKRAFDDEAAERLRAKLRQCTTDRSLPGSR